VVHATQILLYGLNGHIYISVLLYIRITISKLQNGDGLKIIWTRSLEISSPKRCSAYYNLPNIPYTIQIRAPDRSGSFTVHIRHLVLLVQFNGGSVIVGDYALRLGGVVNQILYIVGRVVLNHIFEILVIQQRQKNEKFVLIDAVMILCGV
jgi:hypothetical protein